MLFSFLEQLVNCLLEFVYDMVTICLKLMLIFCGCVGSAYSHEGLGDDDDPSTIKYGKLHALFMA